MFTPLVKKSNARRLESTNEIFDAAIDVYKKTSLKSDLGYNVAMISQTLHYLWSICEVGSDAAMPLGRL